MASLTATWPPAGTTRSTQLAHLLSLGTTSTTRKLYSHWSCCILCNWTSSTFGFGAGFVIRVLYIRISSYAGCRIQFRFSWRGLNQYSIVRLLHPSTTRAYISGFVNVLSHQRVPCVHSTCMHLVSSNMSRANCCSAAHCHARAERPRLAAAAAAAAANAVQSTLAKSGGF